VKNLGNKGIHATGLNADTIAAARREGRDIWKECAAGHHQVIICSPEQLGSIEMNELIAQDLFQCRVGLVVVDEVHLIPIWGGKVSGREFRRAFNAIGDLRSLLRSHTVFLGLSATLMPGKPLEVVQDSLGFKGKRFSFMKLDCERTNLHLVLRRIQYSFSSGTFADLDWLLDGLQPPAEQEPWRISKTVVYVDNIMLGFKLVLYLQQLLPLHLQSCANRIIRHLHASTCPKCKDEILHEFSQTGSSELRIVVATEAFGCGIDIPDIERAVVFGTPPNVDSAYQRLGRTARQLPKGEGYIYVNARTWDMIKEQLGLLDRSKSKRTRTGESTAAESEVKCCEHFKQLLVAHLTNRCLSECINRLYGNPMKEERCMR
jgi:superfamily II DNA helicase RecQ